MRWLLWVTAAVAADREAAREADDATQVANATLAAATARALSALETAIKSAGAVRKGAVTWGSQKLDGTPTPKSIVAMEQLEKELELYREQALDQPYQIAKDYSTKSQSLAKEAKDAMNAAMSKESELAKGLQDGVMAVTTSHKTAERTMKGIPKKSKKNVIKTIKKLNKISKKFGKKSAKVSKKLRKKDMKNSFKQMKKGMKLYKKWGKGDKKFNKKVLKWVAKAKKKFLKQEDNAYEHQREFEAEIFQLTQELLDVADSAGDANVETGKQIQMRGSSADWLLNNGMNGLTVKVARAEQVIEHYFQETDRAISQFLTKSEATITLAAQEQGAKTQENRATALRAAASMDRFYTRFSQRAQMMINKVKTNFKNELAVVQNTIALETGKNSGGREKLKAVNAAMQRFYIVPDEKLHGFKKRNTANIEGANADLMGKIEREFESQFQYLANTALTIDGKMAVKGSQMLADGLGSLEKIRIIFEAYLAKTDETNMEKYDLLNHVISQVVKLASSRDGKEALEKAKEHLATLPPKLEAVLEYLRVKDRETRKITAKTYLIAQQALQASGIASAIKVQETERTAGAGIGNARTAISTVIVNKAIPVMRDVGSWTAHAMGKSNQIKGAMVMAEYELNQAERRLAGYADNMNQIGSRIEAAGGQTQEAAKDADVKSSMVGTLLNEAASGYFGKLNGEAKQGIGSEIAAGESQASAFKTSGARQLGDFNLIVGAAEKKNSREWNDLQGTGILEAQEASSEVQAAGGLFNNLEAFDQQAEAEVGASNGVVDGEAKELAAKNAKALQEVKQQERENEMAAKSGMSGVIGRFDDDTARSQMSIINAAALDEQQLFAQSQSSKQSLGASLEKVVNQMYNTDSKLEFFKSATGSNQMSDAVAIGYAAEKATKALVGASAHVLLALKAAREEVTDKVMAAISVVKNGPGGLVVQSAHFKNLMDAGVKEIRTLQAAENKLWQKIAAQERLISVQAVAAMREAIRKQQAKTRDVQADILDRRDGLMSRLQAALADIKSRISGIKTGQQFAAEGSEAQLKDMLEKDTRFRSRMKSYERDIALIGAKTKKSALGLLSSLDTTAEKNTATRRIESLFGLRKGMLGKTASSVGKNTDMIDDLFSKFSKELQDSAQLLVPLRTDVSDQKDLAKAEFDTLTTAVEGDESVAQELIDQAGDVANELNKHMSARKLAMEERFKGIQSKLTALQGASSWQGSGMLEQEEKQLDHVLKIQKTLRDHIDNVLDPQHRKWHDGLSEVLERMSLYEDSAKMNRHKPQEADALRLLKAKVAAKHAGVMRDIDGYGSQLQDQLLNMHGQSRQNEAEQMGRARALRMQIAKTIQPSDMSEKQYGLMDEQWGAGFNASRDGFTMQKATRLGEQTFQSEVDRLGRYTPKHTEGSIRDQLAALSSSFLEAGEFGHASDFRAVQQQLRALDESRDAEVAQLDEGLERMEATQSSE
jgi:hypothetical protein